MTAIIAKTQTFGFTMTKKQRISENLSISCQYALSPVLGRCFQLLVLFVFLSRSEAGRCSFEGVYFEQVLCRCLWVDFYAIFSGFFQKGLPFQMG